MTTHEGQAMTESPEEPPTAVSESPRTKGTAVAPDAEPIADAPSQHADASSTDAPAAEPASAQHESSMDDVVVTDDDLAELRARWAGVQAAFVDDPKDCVHQADALVSDVFEQLTTGFAQVRSRLEEQWVRGEEASTEDLRLALVHYRKFFERLLAV
ncbi:MAG: hypothetical protein JOY55_05010 [Mycobacterium sp.]|nr:hypothetical protein [Mycobacterium sp.]MBV8291170.1 hypothetical protein [Mycobacterium sp.]